MLAEVLLVLIVLTLGTSLTQHGQVGEIVDVVRFRASSDKQEAAKSPEPEKAKAKETKKVEKVEPKPPREVEPPKEPPKPVPRPQPSPLPKIAVLSPKQMATANIAPAQPAAPAPAPNRAQFGPADTRSGAAADSKQVGTGPHGEPLYAAAWYREPSDSELSGYLSTANGPGWGLIACRTVADYHVDDCVMLDEYPTGSNIGRAVLAAAWQFQVRPPRIGGRPQIGEWVRIRIDYGMRTR